MHCNFQNVTVPTGVGTSTPRCFSQVVGEIVIDKNRTLLYGFNFIYPHILSHSPPQKIPFHISIHSIIKDIKSLFLYYKLHSEYFSIKYLLRTSSVLGTLPCA